MSKSFRVGLRRRTVLGGYRHGDGGAVALRVAGARVLHVILDDGAAVSTGEEGMVQVRC